jgi:hypothetical protein
MKGFLVVMLLIVLASPAEATCIRCALDSLVCAGDSKFDLLDQCGGPDLAEGSGTGFLRNDELADLNLETLFYNCGEKQFVKIITVRGGRISSIEEGERGSGPTRCF